MKTLYFILITANIFIHAGKASVQTEEYIRTAYALGQESLILEIIDNELVVTSK